jgi:hypothetical protein
MHALAHPTTSRTGASAMLVVTIAVLAAACSATSSKQKPGQHARSPGASPSVSTPPTVVAGAAVCAADSRTTRTVPGAALRALRRYVRLVDGGRSAAAAASAAAGTPAADPRPLRRIANLRLLSVAGRY